jgi:hypothetical protein
VKPCLRKKKKNEAVEAVEELHFLQLYKCLHLVFPMRKPL